MASISSPTCSLPKQLIDSRFNGLNGVPFTLRMFASPSLRSSRRDFPVLCAAKPETVNKVCEIVKSQLALPKDHPLTPDSKFSELGADSLDTVEIVMSLEEEFQINVEEENSESITTVQEAADLIERLVEKKGGEGAKA